MNEYPPIPVASMPAEHLHTGLHRKPWGAIWGVTACFVGYFACMTAAVIWA